MQKDPGQRTTHAEVAVEREELLLLLQATAATVGRACTTFATDNPDGGGQALRRQGLFLAWLANAASARRNAVRLASLVPEERDALLDQLACISLEASRERRTIPEFANDMLDAESLIRLIESHDWEPEGGIAAPQ